MREKKNFELKLGDKKLIVQIGGLAEQASGCCLARQGDTSVLTTSQLGTDKPEMGFFPLTCAYEERFYAAGKILGSRFIKREGRPSVQATLISRMIDRGVRPLFPKALESEVQVIATCLSWDAENDPAVLGILGASLALGLSEIPWQGPMGAVRIGYVDGQLLLNPTYEQREGGNLDLVLVGVERDGRVLVNMIEGSGNEVKEEIILKAFDFAVPFLSQLIQFQKEIIKKEGKEKLTVEEKHLPPKLEETLKKFLGENLEKAVYQKDKQNRHTEWLELQNEMLEKFADRLAGATEEEKEENVKLAKNLFIEETEKLVKENILKKDKRPDGRKLDEIRGISGEVGVVPRTHGSGMFQRGITRVLSVLTLGGPGDQQLLEEMEISGKKRFFHHYNFPPYSSGEVKRLGSPGRRELGHGMLAEKAVLPLLPSVEDFPYTVRVVSEILSSNGSTSMGAVSGTCLALMDGGVPIKKPAAGIAVGLVRGKTVDEFKLFTDIQGPEDHHGDMDFKVAGTFDGVTVVQMDVKMDGITKEILRGTLEAAQKARLEILEKMQKVIPAPRKELSPFAPRIYILRINPDKIGAVIGTGGKVINEIIEECGVTIDIEETGEVFITADKEAAAEKAIKWIKNLTRELKVGEIFQGKVVRILDFGAFVELVPGQDGLVHISEFAPYRVERVQDLVKIGDIIPVKIISIDEQGKISLSAKEAGFKTPPNKGDGRPPIRSGGKEHPYLSSRRPARSANGQWPDQKRERGRPANYGRRKR